MRLEVPVAKLKLKPGTIIDGWAFTQHGGTVYWDKAGIETQTPQDGQAFDSLTAWVRAQRASGSAGLPANLKAIVALERSKRTEAQTNELRAYFIEHAYAKTSAIFEPLRSKLEQAERTRKQLDEQIPTTLVFREKAGEPKPAFLLKRGEYDQRGEKVGRAVPAFLPPLPPGRAGQPPGPGPVAGRPQSPADGPGGGQPLLAPGLRHRASSRRPRISAPRASRPAIPSCSTGWRSSSARTAGTSSGS